MGHSRFGRIGSVGLLLLLSGCGGRQSSADSPSASAMSPTDARAFIAQIQRDRGMAIDTTPVTTMDQLLQALAQDEIGRFGSAEQLVAGKPGIDALTIHASIELAWSDDFITFARILEQLAKRADFEIKRLRTKGEESSPLSALEAKALEQNEKNASFDEKAKLALEVLAAEHLRTASSIVDQALRQFPKDPLTYRVAAYLSLLSREWPNFDAAMSWFVETEQKDAGLVYLRGFEALKRRRVPQQATLLFREALRLNPSMVRAQAKLVLSEDGIDATYAEFEKLRALAPEHPMVSLLGPSITSDYELSSSFRRARAARQSPAATDTSADAPPPAAP